MRRFGLFLVILILIATWGWKTISARSQEASNAPQQSSQDEHTRRSMAVNLLRAINTAEVEYQVRKGKGSFANWSTLSASEEFKGRAMEFAVHNEPQLGVTPLRGFHFIGQLSQTFEVLPGWMMRFNLHADGHGYDVMLEDTADKTSGYAIVTDERAVIREARSI